MAPNDQVRTILRQIVEEYGPFHNNDDDIRRCRGLLRDLAGAHTLEVNLLLRAMENRVQETLLANRSSLVLFVPRLIQELQNTHGISAENARWAVESWMLALGLTIATSPAISRGATKAKDSDSHILPTTITPPVVFATEQDAERLAVRAKVLTHGECLWDMVFPFMNRDGALLVAPNGKWEVREKKVTKTSARETVLNGPDHAGGWFFRLAAYRPLSNGLPLAKNMPVILGVWRSRHQIEGCVFTPVGAAPAPAPAPAVDPKTIPTLPHNFTEPAPAAGAAGAGSKVGGVITTGGIVDVVKLPERKAATQRTQSVSLVFDWVTIPAGEFLMGSDESKDAEAGGDESPQHTIYLPAFRIARVPMTNAQYKKFVDATGHQAPGHWKNGQIPDQKEEHPVVNVSWTDAVAFCQWAQVRLPTEAEWEKAARGTDGRIYPWGNESPRQDICNFNVGFFKAVFTSATTSVDAHPLGKSPYGCLDMAGNVWEWTGSLYKSYPYAAGDGREDPTGSGRRVLRGGSFDSYRSFVRCAFRLHGSPDGQGKFLGFRVVSPGL